MSGFLEDEAEVSGEDDQKSGSESDEDSGGVQVKEVRHKKKSKAVVVDSSEEEEDDEDLLREEMKDLINDDVEEESASSGSDDNADRGRKRKKRGSGEEEDEDDDDDDDRLEDEDYDLIEENLGVKVKRKKFRRLRKISDDDDSDNEAGHDLAKVDDRDAIANELFQGSDDDESTAEPRRPESVPEEVGDDEEGEEESDVDDFIVDDEGEPISKEKTKKKRYRHADAALQEAQDIFGVDFDMTEFDQYGDDGYEEYEEAELDYEDEEVEEGEEATRTKKKPSKKKAKKSIFDVYEPSELERSHFTEVDNTIRTSDVPERFQLRSIHVKPTEERELEEEADWIYKHAFCTPPISIQDMYDQVEGLSYTNTKGPTAIGKIREALNFMRNQQFEVPFIAFYRKEYVEPDLNINDLWKVYHWDEKWSQLRRRKKNLTRLFERMQHYQYEQVAADVDQPLADSFRTLSAQDIERVNAVETPEELQDVYGHFLLYYGRELAKMHNKTTGAHAAADGDERSGVSENIKHASRQDGYTLCVDAGLDGFAKKFGLTPEQFSENLRDNYQRHEVDQYPTEPTELAIEYLSSQFSTAEDVIKGAQHMVATQISREPLVRQCVRQTYYERAKIHIAPTKKGKKEIDENHMLYSLKYIKNKPVKDLKGDQFLKMSMAESDGLIKITMGIDLGSYEGHQSYYEEIKQLYYRDEFSHTVQEWNQLREQTLQRALNTMLYPFFAKELKWKLLQEAKDGIIKASSRKLYNWLKIAPYQAEQQLEDYDDEDYDPSHGLRVISIAFVPELDMAAFAAFVDGEGNMQDFLRLCHLNKRKNSYHESDKTLKETDLRSLKRFITSKKPHVVVVGTDCRDAAMIQQDVQELVTDLESDNQMAPISVELVDNELSEVYSTTKRADQSFRDYPPLLRQAISLARRIQDPLIEFSQLCAPDEEILCLRYHPLQDQVSKDDLLYALQLEFINRTNEVGVDINRALAHPHTAFLLQFVCGLGPRKAAGLLKVLKQNNGRLENRTQLVTVCHMGPKVFMNCAGFIKIDTNSLGDSTEAYVEVLDGSRVHPETYEWARKMAVDALEYDDTVEDANPAAALEEILESPERLKDLDLDAFAEELERQGYGNKAITLYDMRAELNHRYKDLRSPYRPPTSEERFNMLTKETPKTFYIGKLVLCRVSGIAHKKPQGEQLDNANPERNEETGLWQCPFCHKSDFPEVSAAWAHFDAGNCEGAATGVKVRLDNGVTGFIPIRNLSDKRVEKPEERVARGMTIHARITKIDIERFHVEVTSKSSDLLDSEAQYKPPRDLYYDADAEENEIKRDEEVRKRQRMQTYVKRVIVHPSFHNIGYKDAEKLMNDMDQGDVIIRPSSKGSDHLTVMWKVDDNIYQHIDVREEGKENAFSLGQSLLINNEEFEDLDEIIARHIQPMAAFARDVLLFKYYEKADGGKREILENLLRDEKGKATTRIPYLISLSTDFPGKFMLSYLPRVKTRHEYATITPDGFRYRGKVFETLNSLLKWFKEHFREPIPGVATPMIGGRTPGLDHSTIQRAVSSLPPQMYNTLAAVAGATPLVGGFSVPQQPFATPLPVATPMMTPSYHNRVGRTPNAMVTPQYQPSSQGNWAHPATPRHHPSATPRTPSYSSSQQQQQHQQQHHHNQHHQHHQQRAAAHSSSRPGAAGAAVDWGKAAAQWAQKSRDATRSTPRQSQRPSPRPVTKPSPRASPRPSPAVQRDSSYRSESPPAGDATPLYDEN